MLGSFNKVLVPLKVRHTLDCIAADTNYFNMYSHTGMDQEILKKGGALCRSPDFRFQMVLKTKKTLETVSFWRKTFFNFFFPYLYLMKTCRWNLINFSKFTNAFIKKKNIQLTLIQQSMKKENWEKLDFALEQNIFYSHLKYQSFFFNRSFCSRFFILQPFFDTWWHKKYQKGELGTANF